MSLEPEERDLLAALAFPIIASDAQGMIEFMNPETERLLGWSSAAVQGQPISTIMPARMRERHRAGIARYVSTHESRLMGKPVRVPAMRPDGSEIDIDLQLRLFRRPDGSDLIVASVAAAGAGAKPDGLIELETKLQRRAYELI